MATPLELREKRKAAGWKEVTVLVPPELAKVMEDQRGETPRSQWLIRQALSLLPQGLVERLTWGRPGRKRKYLPPRTPTLPDLAIPLQHLTYQRISLAEHFAREAGGGAGSVTLMKTTDDQTLVTYRYGAMLGNEEIYTIAYRMGGRWRSSCYVQDGHGDRTIERGMLMPTARHLQDFLAYVNQRGGRVIDERAERPYTPTIRVRPLIRRIGDEPQAWSLEIDASQARENGDLPALHRFLTTVYRWSPPMVNWFSVKEVPDLLVSSGVSEAALIESRRLLHHLGAEVRDDQPWGIAQDVVTARLDPLGIIYTIEANQQDRRCIAVPTDCSPRVWPDWQRLLDELGVETVEQHPEEVPLDIDWSKVPGWNEPSAGGKTLRGYQREGVEFIASRGWRCMIGDAMRVGKTAQSIAAVHAKGCRRIVCILPLAVVHVWRKQIAEWNVPGHPQRIIEVRTSTNPPALSKFKDGKPDDCMTWVLCTYDKLTPRTENIWLRGAREGKEGYREDQFEEIGEAFAEAGAADAVTKVGPDLKISLTPDDELLIRAVEQVRLPEWVKEAESLRNALVRVNGPVREALMTWDPDAVLLDEAHRIKNPRSGRTRSVRMLIQVPHRLGLLLSGTMIRNYFDTEGIPMLEALVSLDDHYKQAKRASVDKATLTEKLFRYYMIRRRLKDVQDQLPAKIRERVDIPLGSKGEAYFDEYLEHMARADEMFFRVAVRGGKMDEARSAALGAWAQARKALALAKIADGLVMDTIIETIEQSEAGCSIVFGHHIEAMDMLFQQLTDKGLNCVKAYGDVTPRQRVEAESRFQSGRADVYIGGLQTAEGISLDRADACVHIEQDWVPGTMLQAEARAEGAGQVAPNGYLIRTCFNSFGLEPFDDMDAIIAGILAKKLSGLNELYEEDETLEAAVIIDAENLQQALAARSWAKAQARMEREGITPESPPDSDGKPTGRAIKLFKAPPLRRLKDRKSLTRRKDDEPEPA
jgi:hypothetical protein